MEIPKKRLDEFKAIYKKDYGEYLTDQEAQIIARKLIAILQIICQPIPGSGEKPASH